MKAIWVVGLVGVTGLWPVAGQAAERVSQEHGAPSASINATAAATPAAGQLLGEQSKASSQPAAAPSAAGQAAPTEPTAEQIRQAIRDYIADIQTDEGAFTLEDEVADKLRTLTLLQVHDRVGKTVDSYYACADMKDDSGETLDVDFDVQSVDNELDVFDVRIHKVNGAARYTYDEHDNRIPL